MKGKEGRGKGKKRRARERKRRDRNVHQFFETYLRPCCVVLGTCRRRPLLNYLRQGVFVSAFVCLSVGTQKVVDDFYEIIFCGRVGCVRLATAG